MFLISWLATLKQKRSPRFYLRPRRARRIADRPVGPEPAAEVLEQRIMLDAAAPEFHLISQFGTSGFDTVRAIALDSTGVYVVGRTTGALTPDASAGDWFDAFVRKYDFSGNELWTHQFGGPWHDSATGVAVYQSGVYVVGTVMREMPEISPGDRRDHAFVRKYDPVGRELWSHEFIGSSLGAAAEAVAVDATGVYVTGGTLGLLPGSTVQGSGSVFVRRYNAEGTELWTRQFESLGRSAWTVADAIAVHASGVYVGGVTTGSFPGHTSGGGTEAFVRGYDADGNELWTRQFGSESGSSGDMLAGGIAADASGVYVVGTVWGALKDQINLGGFRDAFLRKYDTQGAEVWTRQFGTASADFASGIAIDESWLYLAGITYGTLPGQNGAGDADAFVAKYDVNGNEVWARQFGTSSFDAASNVAVGASAVYVAGNTQGALVDQTSAGEIDAFVGKLDEAFDPVDLRLKDLNVHTDQLWAGEPVTVSWTGSNRIGTPVLGNWVDAVYLSSDDQWDLGDVRLATVPHAGGLSANETYSESTEVIIPGKLPGSYHILVRPDIQFQQQAPGGPDSSVATAPLSLGIRELPSDGSLLEGTLTREDRADYYAVHVAAGNVFRLNLDGHAAGGVNELYVSFESIPTRQRFDRRAASAGPDQQIVFTEELQGGTYYVLIYGSAIETSTAYALSAETAPLFVSAITPDRHGVAHTALVTITGAGFDSETEAQFIAPDGSILLPSNIQILSSSTLRADLGLVSWPLGVYDVRIVKGSASAVLPDSFEVRPEFSAHLKTNLIVPSVIGLGTARQTLWIEYTNTGLIAMPAPLLKLTANNGALLTTDPTILPQRGFGAIPGTSNSVQVLGLGATSTPWVLQPGETGRIPVYYVGLLGAVSQVTFSLGTLTADTTREIDWDDQVQRIRPDGLEDFEWESQFVDLRNWFGKTWGSYLGRLHGAVKAWTEYSAPSHEVADLFEYSKLLLAEGLSVEAGPIDEPVWGSGLSNVIATAIDSPVTEIPHEIGSPYGWRRSPFGLHRGIDIPYPMKTPLGAVTGGDEWIAFFGGGEQLRGGWQVSLENPKTGQRFVYLHVDPSTEDLYLDEGRRTILRSVKPGDLIAFSGRSGKSASGGTYDPHLHLQMGGGGNPLPHLPAYVNSAVPVGQAFRVGGDGALDETSVRMRLRVCAPSMDLYFVSIDLIAVDGVDLAAPQLQGILWVDHSETAPRGLIHEGRGIWSISADLINLPPIKMNPSEKPGTWTFRVQAFTYKPGNHSEVILEYSPPRPTKAEPPVDPKQTRSSQTVGSRDPNDKLAPAGYGEAVHVQADGTLAYQIRFENVSDATAPAREIVVTDTLDEDLDLSTFELLDIAFANQTIAIPPGLRHYEALVPMNAGGTETLVEVIADLNLESRELTLTLRAVDPSTGWFPEDPLVGILYPNDETGRGEGSISYLVKPKAGLPSGTRIENQARIVFDFNDPIDTPLVFNTLDAGTPTSSILPLPATVATTTFHVHWSGEDEPGGSGIGWFDVYVAENGGAYLPWLLNVTSTSETFVGQTGSTYAFYTVATDNVGQRELAPATPDAVITVVPAVQTLQITAGPDLSATEGDLVILADASYAYDGDPNLLSLTIDWGDGTIEPGLLVPGNGGGTIASAHQYADDGTYVVVLTLSDQTGATVEDSVTITVANAAPVLTGIASGGAAIGDAAEGQPITFSAIFTDAGLSDTHSALIHWGDGTTSDGAVTATAGTGAVSASHVYRDGGVYTITIVLQDDEGAEAVGEAIAYISGAGVHDGVLQVVGTQGNDHVTINAQGKGQIKVHASFLPDKGRHRTFPVGGITSILVLLGEGNDHATIAGNVSLPVLLDGGPGDDHLNGGAGPNILIGGPGNDRLIGGRGRDLLIGGVGADELISQSAEDILIGGWTTFDSDTAALWSLLAEWLTSRSQEDRIANLTGSGTGPQENGDNLLRPGLPVFSDDDQDRLNGGPDRDWLFGSLNDRLQGRLLDDVFASDAAVLLT